MRGTRLIPVLASLCTLLLQSPLVVAGGETNLHEAGRCAIRGHCGKKSIFGGDLPCPDNDVAREPGESERKKLVELCGQKWATGPVCCLDEQVGILLDLYLGRRSNPYYR